MQAVAARGVVGHVPGDQATSQPLRLRLGQVGGGSCRARGHGQHVRGQVVAEQRVDPARHREGDVAATGGTSRSVVLVPAQSVGHLGLVAARRERRGESVGAVAVGVLEPRPHAVRLPVGRAPELALEAARSGDDRSLGVGGHPVAGVVVVERHVPSGGEAERDVGPVQRRTLAVVLVPRLVDRGLVLVVALGQRDLPGPHQAVGVERHLGLVALGLPVARAADLGVVGTGHRHVGRLRDRTAGTARLSGGRIPDGHPGRGRRQVAAAVAQDRAVLQHRVPGQVAEVVEDAVRRVVVRAEPLPGVPADGPPREGDLVEPAVRNRRRHLGALPHRPDHPARAQVVEQHGGRVGPRGQPVRRPVDGRGQRRHGDGDPGLVVGAQSGVGAGPHLPQLAVLHEGREGHRLGSRRVVDGDDVLPVLPGRDPAERVDAGAVAGVAVHLGTVGERRVLLAQPGQRGDGAVERVPTPVAVGRRRRGGADQVVVVVRRDRAGEHVLPGVLVAPVAGEALLVAVVDDRLATGEVHQRVGELVAAQQLVARERVVEEAADASHVVVAEEGRERVGVGVGVGVEVVGGVEAAQPGGRQALGEVEAGALEAEVEGGVETALGGEGRQVGRVAVEDLAEREEVVVADGGGVLTDRRGELLPELQVDVLDGVDAEPVDAEVDPGLVDVGHALDHVGLLGEQVVEAAEVAVRRALAGVGAVAAVVVVRRVVEPRRHLDGAVGHGAQDGGARERRGRVHRRERPGEVVPVVERSPRRVAVGLGGLVDVGVRALGVVDDVGGVVGDDVEEDLDAPGVGPLDERRELGVGAEVRIDPGEVGDPVAVVARGGRGARALDRTVLEARREPDRGGAEPVDVVELLAQPGDVTPVEEPLVGRVEAVRQPVTGDPAPVVGPVSVGEPVGHHEVEALPGERRAQAVARQGAVLGGDLGAAEVGGLDTDPVRGLVVGEDDPGGLGQHQRQVPTALGAVGLVPAVVDRDLELVAAGRDPEGARPDAVAAGAQVGVGAVRGPVGRAAELALERADQGDRGGRIRVVGRRGLPPALLREGGAGQDRGEQGDEGTARGGDDSAHEGSR